MRRSALALALVAWGAGCVRADSLESPLLLARARAALEERGRKLQAYSFRAVSTHQGQRAVHRFAFLAPDRSRGELLEPRRLVRAWDGSALLQLDADRKTWERYASAVPEERLQLTLARIFTPMVPEGFRPPLLPAAGVTARWLPADGGASQLELRARVQDGEEQVEARWWYRWPAMDFLGKSASSSAGLRETRVEAEACSAPMGLCVPTVLLEMLGGQLETRMELGEVRLDPEPGHWDFSPGPPDGWSQARRTLVVPTDLD